MLGQQFPAEMRDHAQAIVTAATVVGTMVQAIGSSAVSLNTACHPEQSESLP
jgi:GrpB-like predicted nucleotidyltransferase (UPF0157 family)